MNIFLLALFAGSCGFFGYNLFKRFLFVRGGRSDNRFSDWGARIKSVIFFVFFQRKMFDSFWIGIIHAIIFWGFLVVMFGTIAGISETVFGFSAISLLGNFKHVYLTILDVAESLIAVAIIAALFRRVIIQPKRLSLSVDGFACLLFIFALMFSDVFSRYAAETSLVRFAQYAHIIILCGFMSYLPFSKHFHLVTAIPNVFFRSLESSGKLPDINCEDESIYKDERQNDFLKNIFSWKHRLDLLTCVECGRCEEVCPASVTGKELSPKKIIKNLQEGLVKNKKSESGDIITSEEARGCTTCGACQNACPLFIEHTPKIINARRFDSMIRGEVPEELAVSINNVISAEGDIKTGNPYGLSRNDRENWAGSNVKRLYDCGEGYYGVLFWVGCSGAYDARIQNVTKACSRIFNESGIDYAILGKEELCCGEWIRRTGNEYLYQILVQKNIEILNKYNVNDIVTFCPHCFNTLKNEYPQFGGKFNVWHHTQFIPKNFFVGDLRKNIVYHDPCYLGRHNKIYKDPRKIIKNILNSQYPMREAKKSRENSFCCGGGGGRAFMEEKRGQKISDLRLDQLLESDPDIIATACPFCKIMLDDSLKKKNLENIKVMDIFEILKL